MKGICHVCGIFKELTLEHIPPKKAYNNTEIRSVGFEALTTRGNKYPWDISDLKYEQHQSGYAITTLCGSCNNNTGSWYGPAYLQFVDIGLAYLRDSTPEAKEIKINLVNIYPLRIIKQVLTMFCSINGEDFIKKQKWITKFLLNKEERSDLGGIKIGIYFSKSPLMKSTGIAGSANLTTGEIKVISELTNIPFCFVMFFDDFNNKYVDISDWSSKFYFDQESTLSYEIPIYENNSFFPLDHRSKEEIMRNRIEP